MNQDRNPYLNSCADPQAEETERYDQPPEYVRQPQQPEYQPQHRQPEYQPRYQQPEVQPRYQQPVQPRQPYAQPPYPQQPKAQPPYPQQINAQPPYRYPQQPQYRPPQQPYYGYAQRQPVSKAATVFSFVSFGVGCFSLLMAGILVLIPSIFASYSGDSVEQSVMLAVPGLVFGILALVKRTPKFIFALLGVIFNGVLVMATTVSLLLNTLTFGY